MAAIPTRALFVTEVVGGRSKLEDIYSLKFTTSRFRLCLLHKKNLIAMLSTVMPLISNIPTVPTSARDFSALALTHSDVRQFIPESLQSDSMLGQLADLLCALLDG